MLCSYILGAIYHGPRHHPGSFTFRFLGYVTDKRLPSLKYPRRFHYAGTIDVISPHRDVGYLFNRDTELHKCWSRDVRGPRHLELVVSRSVRNRWS